MELLKRTIALVFALSLGMAVAACQTDDMGGQGSTGGTSGTTGGASGGTGSGTGSGDGGAGSSSGGSGSGSSQ